MQLVMVMLDEQITQDDMQAFLSSLSRQIASHDVLRDLCNRGIGMGDTQLASWPMISFALHQFRRNRRV